MTFPLLALLLLVIAGSLASWLFSRWLTHPQRRSAAAMVLIGAGAVSLLGAVAVTVVSIPELSTRFWPQLDLTAPLLAPAGSTEPVDRFLEQRPAEPDATEPDAAMTVQEALENKISADLLELETQAIAYEQQVQQGVVRNDLQQRSLAGQHVMRQDASRAIDAAADAIPVSFRPNAAGPPAAAWTATDCVKSSHSSTGGSGRWFIDNECGGVIAVVFAWCREARDACVVNGLTPTGWRYEPAGIVMTSATQPVSTLRLRPNGPLVAATYVSEQGDHLRIRYLACHLSAPQLLALLEAAAPSSMDQQQQFEDAARRDECYRRVLKWSEAGQRAGTSPDTLLRKGAEG